MLENQTQLAAIRHAQNVTTYSLGFRHILQAACRVYLPAWPCSLSTESTSSIPEVHKGGSFPETFKWKAKIVFSLSLIPLQYKLRPNCQRYKTLAAPPFQSLPQCSKWKHALAFQKVVLTVLGGLCAAHVILSDSKEEDNKH